MTTNLKEMMDAANAAVPWITPAQARDMVAQGNALIVDVRDALEVEKSGRIAGAVNVSRGLLEFRADPDSPSHDKSFAKDKNVIIYCGSGGRAALSGKVLKDMGYERVYNLGGFKDWAENAVAAVARCRNLRRGSFMVMLHQLEQLPRQNHIQRARALGSRHAKLMA